MLSGDLLRMGQYTDLFDMKTIRNYVYNVYAKVFMWEHCRVQRDGADW